MKTLSEIDYLRGKIDEAHEKGVFVPALQKESAIVMAYASTTIEGSTLTPQEVRTVANGEIPRKPRHHIQMVKNYLQAIEWIRKNEGKKTITLSDILILHRIIGEKAVDGGPVGKFRNVQVFAGDHTPPVPDEITGLISRFIKWFNKESVVYHPAISSALLHFAIATIHPFRDGNGRVARILASWELYRRGFDTFHIFTIDDLLLENRQFYYRQLSNARKPGKLGDWIEYMTDATAEGLERAYKRLKSIRIRGRKLAPLSETQKKILTILSAQGPRSIKQLLSALHLTRQGLHKSVFPLLKQKRVVLLGTRRSRKYGIQG
ncbi:MAG TPA: Fic family protein [bacterium]|nr:Fic family protein [bacterium]